MQTNGSIVEIIEMNHDPLPCLATRVMRCGKFDLLLCIFPVLTKEASQ